jgi:hypothetical protein
VAGRTQNGNNWRAHASIAGFGFNDHADERDYIPINDTDVCGKNDSIHGDND